MKTLKNMIYYFMRDIYIKLKYKLQEESNRIENICTK